MKRPSVASGALLRGRPVAPSGREISWKQVLSWRGVV
jgi:hypothetical protein